MAHKFPFARKDYLDSEPRRQLLPAEKTLQSLGLKLGARLLDVGCGTGYFSIPAAAIVGENGSVIGFDMQPEFIRFANERITNGPPNLAFRVCEENRLPQPDASADAVLISAVLHETQSPQEFLRELKRVLVAAGRLWIVEWLPVEMDHGPPLHERIAPDALRAMLAEAGFASGPIIPLGDAYYGVVAGIQTKAFQDYYPDSLSHCYGCGRLNEQGLHIKSYWDGDESVCTFTPWPQHIAIPGMIYGGLIASLIDCHSTGTAAAAAYRAEGREMDTMPPRRFLTASLQVDYLKPTPAGVPLIVRGQVEEIKARKVIVVSTLSADGVVCARGRVVAIRVPDEFVSE